MSKANERISTGVPGLDEVLHGGLIAKRAYLVRGSPGAGKTTLGLHYLTSGADDGEEVLLICLGEPEGQIRQNAQSLGLDLKGVTFLDLSPGAGYFTQVETYDIFSPDEVERAPITQKITDQVEKLKPSRVFIDSMTQFRYMATDTFQFRKQVLSFIRFLVEQGATVLFTSESSPDLPDDDLMFLSDGIIDLKDIAEDHYLSMGKFRGSGFQKGLHFVRLNSMGMTVSPRLLPTGYRKELVAETTPSKVPELDKLLNGGLKRGTVTVITGPTGVGKTTLGLLFMKAAAENGEHPVLYAFEEGAPMLLDRCENINIPLRNLVEQGKLSVVNIEPLMLSPEEFARMVRREVEERGTRIVMLDSISGYNLTLDSGNLVSHLHALCKYLANMGVTTIFVNETEAITGDFRATEVGISYMADNIIFMCYLELNGELRKAIGVLKKRLGDFEKTMREMKITSQGVEIGQPLTGLRGILRGTPEILEPMGDEE
jgi:circadian clock protein KaiC